jgi:hypothetical protein
LLGVSTEVIELLDRRDRQLEDALNQQPIIFDHDAGAPLRSKAWTAKAFAKVHGWNVELGQDEAGDDVVLDVDWTIQMHFDGVQVESLTLPAGEVYIEHSGPLPTIPRGTRITLFTDEIAEFDFVSTVRL